MAPVRVAPRPSGAAAARRPDAIPISAHFHLLRRYLKLVAGFAVLGLATGLLAAGTQAPSWISGATVLAPAIARDPQVPPDKVVRRRQAMTLDSEASVLMSRSVLQRAVAGTSLTPDDVAQRTTITAVPNSRVIRVQVLDTDRGRAQVLVGSLIAAYLDNREQLLVQRRSRQSEALRREIAALQASSQLTSDAYRALKTSRAATAGGSRSAEAGDILSAVYEINAEIRRLRAELIDLEARPVLAGELLRSPSTPRRLNTFPQVPILSWIIIGLAAALVVAAVRERFPRPPGTAADVIRLPLTRRLPVGVLDERGAVHGPSAGWVRIADAIGPRPVAVTVVPVQGRATGEAVDTLGIILRRRGYGLSELVGFDHDRSGPTGAAQTMRRIRSWGRHVICEGPPVSEFVAGLSALATDQVILLVPAGSASAGRIARVVDELSRFGLPIAGIILDRSRMKSPHRGRSVLHKAS